MLSMAKSKKINDSLGIGNALRAAKYQKNNWSSKGIFLNISIYHSAILETKKFFESRATPIVTPKIVAKKIPRTATSIVFNNPTK